MTPNDTAYIKVSKELLLARNDLTILCELNSFVDTLNTWQLAAFKDMRKSRLHSHELTSLSRIVCLMGEPEELRRLIKRLDERVNELEKLSESYIEGKDIVMEKLSHDS